MSWLKRNREGLLIGGATGLAAGFLGIVLAAILVRQLWSEVAAAWAQAILTALAVFLAAWLQDRSIDRRERRALQGQRASAVALIEAAAERIRGVSDALRSQEAASLWETIGAAPSTLQAVAGTLQAFPAQLLADREGILIFARAAALIEIAEERSRVFRDQPKPMGTSALYSKALAEAAFFKKVGDGVQNAALHLASHFSLPADFSEEVLAALESTSA